MSRHIASAFLLLMISMSALAQNPRTFVATTGLDTNSCILSAPCRSFARAISQTNPKGEIIALDSGGYGPFAIDRAISIAAAPGQYAAITVPSGGSGVAITSPAASPVVLKGLNISMVAGGYGIITTTYGSLSIDRCTINGGTGGIFIAGGDSSSRFVISDTVVRHVSDTGFVLTGHGALVRDRAESCGGDGFRIGDLGVVSAVDCVAAHNVERGFVAESQNAVAVLNLHHCLSTNNNMGVNAYGLNQFAAYVRVKGSTVTENRQYGLKQGGTSELDSLNNNLVAGNALGDVNGTVTIILPH